MAPDVARLRDAYQAKQYSKGLRVAKRVVGLRPDDPAAHYWRGMLLSAIEDFEPARIALERARSLAPQEPAILSALAMAYVFLQQWDDADRTATRALQLAPADETAQAMASMVAFRQRVIATPITTPPQDVAPTTPGEVVEQFMRSLLTQPTSTAVGRYVDDNALELLMSSVNYRVPKGRNRLEDFYMDLLTLWRLNHPPNSTLGFEVLEPTAPPPDDPDARRGAVIVTALVLSVTRMSELQISLLREGFARPEFRQHLDPSMLTILTGLNESDRDAFLQRRGARAFPGAVELSFKVMRTLPRRKLMITELTIDGKSLQSIVALELANAQPDTRPSGQEPAPREPAQAGAEQPPAENEKSGGGGYLVALLVFLGAIGLVTWLLSRRQGKRRRR